MHGYVFSDKATTKGAGHPKVAPTPNGYVPKETKPAPIDVVNYYDYLGWTGTESTNNAAEVLSIASALSYATTIDNLGKVTVYCDNQYAVKGTSTELARWVSNGWLKRDGTPVQNQGEWRNVLDSVKILNDRGTKIRVEWVKGHADNFGNVQADGLATIAGTRSEADRTAGHVELKTPSTGYWKSDIERHPMLGLRGFLFQTDKTKSKPGEYYLTNQVKSDEFIGRKDVNSSMAYVLVNEPDKLMELVRDIQCEQSREFDTLVLARVDRIYDKAVSSALDKFGTCVLKRVSNRHLNMHFVNERAMAQPAKKEKEDAGKGLPITEELYPPRLAFRCVETISTLSGLVDSFRKTVDHNPVFTDGKVFDITSSYFEEVTDKHGVVSKGFKKSIHAADQFIMVRLTPYTKEVDFKIIFGIHTLARNNMKRLEGTDVRVWLVVQKVSAFGFRYVTVVKSGDDWGAFSGVNGNLIIFGEPLE